MAILFADVAADVAVLTAANFDELVFKDDVSSFIKFYAPWCGHCKAIAPAWEALGATYADSSGQLIGSVDCTAHADLCERFNIQGYPTVKLLQAGNTDLQDYQGEMGAEALQTFAAERLVPACTATRKEVCSVAQLEDLNGFLEMPTEQRVAELERISAPLKEEEEKLEKLNERLEKLEEKVEEQEDLVEKMQASLAPKIRLLKSAIMKAPEADRPKAPSDKDEP